MSGISLNYKYKNIKARHLLRCLCKQKKYKNEKYKKNKNIKLYVVIIASLLRVRAIGVVNSRQSKTITMKLQLTWNNQRLLSTDNGPESISVNSILPQMDEINMTTKNVINEEAGVTEGQQTTKFTNDGITVESSPSFYHSISRLFINSSDSSNSMDIKSFLAKPVVLKIGDLSTGDLPTSVMYDSFLPSVLTVNPVYSTKLIGYHGIRATIVLRLIINGTPFHQGRYMLYHIPLGGVRVNTKEDLFIKAHKNTLFERTQLQRIELDVTCDTEGIMKIPFSSVLNYYPLRNDNAYSHIGNTGYFAIQPYDPLQTVGGSSSIGYTLYGHFEDVELIGAAVPQMAISPSEKESREAGGAPVSSTILAFSRASAALSSVPMLSSFASTTSWALDVMGKTAKAAGFSKPQMFSANHRVITLPGSFMGNVDGFDQSITLGSSSENTIPVLPGFAGTDVDEMAIVNIVQIPAFFKMVSWPTTAPADSNLAVIPLRPNAFSQVRVFSGRDVYNHTPVSFVGNMFDKWRGSFKFKIKFMKTIFHSGRLSFSFSPENSKLSNPAYSVPSDVWLHREIVDIRTCNEVEFIVPYMNIAPWLDSSEIFGYVYINVIDRLSAPSNVPSAINFAIEVSGGQDMEFAFPSSVGNGSTLGCAGLPALGIVPQSGEDPCQLLSTVIGSDEMKFASVLNSEICIGEKISSLRSLGKIFRPQRLSSILVSGKIESQMIFNTQVAYYNGAGWNNQTFLGDFIDLISGCYLYSRGSIRVKKLNAGYAARSVYTVLNAGDNFATLPFVRGNSDVLGVGLSAQGLTGGKFVLNTMTDNNGVVEVTVPQLHNFHSRVVPAEMQVDALFGNAPSSLGSGLKLNTFASFYNGDYVNSADVIGYNNFRAMGDDFCLGGFISTVPCFYDTSNGFL